MLISARILYTYRTATAHAVGDSKIWKAAVIVSDCDWFGTYIGFRVKFGLICADDLPLGP